MNINAELAAGAGDGKDDGLAALVPDGIGHQLAGEQDRGGWVDRCIPDVDSRVSVVAGGPGPGAAAVELVPCSVRDGLAKLLLFRRTIAAHVSHILKKLAVRWRLDIAREAALRTIAARWLRPGNGWAMGVSVDQLTPTVHRTQL